MKRKFILFITVLFSIVMLSSTTVVCAAEYREEPADVFQLILCADDSLVGGQSKPDLSGIKVEVYSSALTSYDNESKLSEFTHHYAFSVYTDANGKIQFTRPSDEMLILVDVSTLPRNTGIAISTKFYRKDITQDKLYISKVEKIEIEKDVTSERQFFVNVYNKEGSRINADYRLSEKNSVISGGTKTICMEASVGDITESCEYTTPFITNSAIQYVESIEELLRKDRTSKVDALNSCLDSFFTYGRSQELIEQVLALKEDTLFYETLSSEQKAVMEEILSVPSYNKSYRSGYFVIYYTSSSNTVPVFITSLMSAIQAADTSLVGGLDFQRPRSNEQGAAEYHIYVSKEKYAGSAYCMAFGDNSGVRTSYIVFPNITDLSVKLDLFQQGIVAHEYMHAINHTYRATGELPSWFKEAWSNWAAVRVQGIASCSALSVNDYLSNTYKSFTTDEDKYGKFLLPLYIRQNYGGDTTVANVIKNLATTGNVFTAMENALPSGVTFESIFSGFMGYNYAPKYFYTTHSNSWSSRPFISADYPLNGYPNNAYGGTINPFAAHYREFDVPAEERYNLDITIRLLDNYGSLSGKLHMNSSSGVVTNWSFTAGSSLVTYSTSIGVSYIKGGISIVNTDSSDQTSYHITIARN